MDARIVDLVDAAPDLGAGADGADGADDAASEPAAPDAPGDDAADAAPDATADGSFDAAEATDAAEAGDDRPGGAMDAAVEPCVLGQTRLCYGGPEGTAGVGACAAGTERCIDTGWTGACEGERLPAAETCNGRDDDCDRMIDDDLPVRTCGLGVCQRSVPTCRGGGVEMIPCVAGTPGVEVCNGRDDDCDGMTDESMPPLPCGVGSCQTASMTCLDGRPAACVPLAPTPEICDQSDNDCDGVADEGMPDGAGCYTWLLGGAPGVGRCLPGALRCDGLAGVNRCVARTTDELPTSEVCNGVDDDCDGLVDENVAGSPCTRAEGACTSRGSTRCRADGTRYCDAPTPAPTTEVCDGRDNDCDNLVDEDPATLAPTPCTVGLGQCARTGVYRCTGPTANTCDATPGTPSAEVCDGVDNNCDNAADDLGPEPGSCTVEHPWCRRRGNWFCTPIGRVCAGGRGGNGDHFDYAEVCNGRDDDCNGLVDEFGTRLPDGTWAPCPHEP